VAISQNTPSGFHDQVALVWARGWWWLAEPGSGCWCWRRGSGPECDRRHRKGTSSSGC
jgi:hypothetical protein